MSRSVAYPQIQKAGTEPAHLERTPRLRVSQIVADYLAHGWSPEEMCRQHPEISLSEAHSAMAYYFDHQQEIDAELQNELTQCERERDDALPSQFIIRMRAQGLL